jgi:hypothetical protein
MNSQSESSQFESSQFESSYNIIDKMTKNDIVKHMQIMDNAISNIKTKMLFCDADGVHNVNLQKYIKLRKYIQYIYDN